MSLSPLGQLALLAVLILVNGFFAAAEIAVVAVQKSRLRQLVESGSRAALALEHLSQRPTRFLATVQVGVTLAGFFAAATSAVNLSGDLATFIEGAQIPVVSENAGSIAVAGITLVLSFLVLVLGELVPKALALQYTERIALLVARPVDVLATVASPLVSFLGWSTNSVARLFGVRRAQPFPFVTEEEIKTMVDAGEEEGVLEEDEAEMIISIFALGDTLAREVMVPRPDIQAIDAGTPLPDALDLIMEAGHSRIPVYEENIDHVVGILYAKDLLALLKDGKKEAPLQEMMRPAYFVPSTSKVDDVLETLQDKRVHIAIVVDEYGGTAGLITIEDILEEIVGEIQDEYDAEEPIYQKVG
ncbi:MAG: hemolysin family protein, partial [Anaerolineae bacterium]